MCLLRLTFTENTFSVIPKLYEGKALYTRDYSLCIKKSQPVQFINEIEKEEDKPKNHS